MSKILLMVLLVMVSNSAMAEWVKAGGSEKLTNYYDSTTIRENGDKVKMWELIDYNSVQETSGGKSYLSVIGQSEFDCKEEQIRSLNFIEYSGNMGNGDLVYSYSDPAKWEPVVPRSIGEKVWKFACGIK